MRSRPVGAPSPPSLMTEAGSGDPPYRTPTHPMSYFFSPGTPFMDLLAASLRYWVVQKMNTDQAWKNVSL